MKILILSLVEQNDMEHKEEHEKDNRAENEEGLVSRGYSDTNEQQSLQSEVADEVESQNGKIESSICLDLPQQLEMSVVADGDDEAETNLRYLSKVEQQRLGLICDSVKKRSASSSADIGTDSLEMNKRKSREEAASVQLHSVIERQAAPSETLKPEAKDNNPPLELLVLPRDGREECNFDLISDICFEKVIEKINLPDNKEKLQNEIKRRKISGMRVEFEGENDLGMNTAAAGRSGVVQSIKEDGVTFSTIHQMSHLRVRAFTESHVEGIANVDQNLTSENSMVEDKEEPNPIEPKTEHVGEVDESLKNLKIYYPARNNPECIEISYLDINCLAPKKCLSSTIMNFYMRYLQGTFVTRGSSTDNHFFTTYFYDKLENAVSNHEKESSFSNLRRWWKGVNIFDKAYILFPVNKDFHWSLVIICMPEKKDDLGPTILHLDSLGLHESQLIFNNVKSFLVEEWKHLNKGEALLNLQISDGISREMSLRIDEKIIEVPQQRNGYDCGLFVLYFMERFLAAAPERLKRRDLTMFGRDWFQPKEASGLRQKIKKQLMEEFEKGKFGENMEGPLVYQEKDNFICENKKSESEEKENEEEEAAPLQALPTMNRAIENLMPKAKDPLLVVDDEGRIFKGMDYYEIKEAIKRHKVNLVKLRLPDNGKKLWVQLQLLEDEFKRRNLHQLGAESKRENYLGTGEGSSGVVSSKQSIDEVGGIPMGRYQYTIVEDSMSEDE